MTISIDGTEVGALVEGLVWTGGIIGLLIFALLLWLVVRPPRRARPRPDEEAIDAEEMLRVMDRMEQRLETLERALAAQDRKSDRKLEAGEAPEQRRVK